MRAPLIMLSVLSLTACMADGEAASSGSSAEPRGTVALVDPAGAARGTASVVQAGSGLRVTVDASGLPAGTHGIHLHTVGKCEAPAFESAGAHWNPTNMKHGKDAPMGPHSGDIDNIQIGSGGNGKLAFTVPNATLASLMDTDGASLVIHAAADDYKTDPSGNSGGRIACGVVTPV